MILKIFKNNQGVISLLAILSLMAIGLFFALSSSQLGLSGLLFGYRDIEVKKAIGLAEGCAEETFQRLKVNNNYAVASGSVNLFLDNDLSCIIQVNDLGLNNREIFSIATSSSVTKKLHAVIYLDNSLNSDRIILNKWEIN